VRHKGFSGRDLSHLVKAHHGRSQGLYIGLAAGAFRPAAAPQIGVHDVAAFNIELLRKEVFQNAAHERAGLIFADDFTQIFERQVQAFE
jgi:hypothetical protein